MECSEIKPSIKEFILPHVYLNQTVLIDQLFRDGVLSFDDIQNGSYTNDELIEQGYAREQITRGDVQHDQEIFEWWLVDDWLARQPHSRGEPTLSAYSCVWWGRTCTGQAICLDFVIEKIYDDWIAAR